jgi:hypothetical protein
VNEGSRRTALVIGAVAAAASLAIASYLYMWRRRSEPSLSPPLRNVSDLLSDCYAKMREIQSHLSEIQPTVLQSPATRG